MQEVGMTVEKGSSIVVVGSGDIKLITNHPELIITGTIKQFIKSVFNSDLIFSGNIVIGAVKFTDLPENITTGQINFYVEEKTQNKINGHITITSVETEPYLWNYIFTADYIDYIFELNGNWSKTSGIEEAPINDNGYLRKNGGWYEYVEKTDHNLLTNRNTENQHTISSITDLQDTLDNKIQIDDVVNAIDSHNNDKDVHINLFDNKQNTLNLDEIDAIEKAKNIDISGDGSKYLSDDGTYKQIGQTGTTNHTELAGRDIDEQHPISAITGLQTILDEKQGLLTTEELFNIADVPNKANKVDIPTDVSQLINDNEYQTSTEVNNSINASMSEHNLSDNAHSALFDGKQETLTEAQLQNIADIPNKANIDSVPNKVSELTNDSAYQTDIEVSNNISDSINSHNTSNISHEGLFSTKQDKLTTNNAGDNVTITEIDGVVKINSIGGSGGTTNHSSLDNLSYEDSGHIGFATSEQGSKADTAIQNAYIGSTLVDKSDNNLNLPAYPTTLPASDVSEWAKQPTKPTYTANEVGALPSNTPLFSGNYTDLTNKPTIPTQTNQLTNNSGFITNSVSDLINYTTTTDLNNSLDSKQNKLTAGANIIIDNTNPSNPVISSDVDIINHANLTNLDYAQSGHTGFATSAQGTKADTAVQTIIAGSNVSVNKNGTEYTISATLDNGGETEAVGFTDVLLASDWNTIDSTQVITVPNIKSNQQGIIGLGSNLTSVQIGQGINAILVKISETQTTLTIKAFGELPTVDIPVEGIIL